MNAKWAMNSDSSEMGTFDMLLKKKGIFCKCQKKWLGNM